MKELPGDVFVAPQLNTEHVATLAEQGAMTIICNRPENEGPMQTPSAEIAAAAREAGLDFVNLPMAGGITPELLLENQEAFDSLPRPIIAYCASGMRSAVLWAFAHVRDLGLEAVTDALKATGYPLPDLSEPLVAYRDGLQSPR